MIDFNKNSRRKFLRYCGASSLLPALMHQRNTAAAANKESMATADACILVLLTGGPSHLDMWDPKPDAPAEIRGPFQTVQTTVPDLRLSEHLPKLAREIHRCSLVRAVHQNPAVRGSHAAAAYTALTGIDHGATVEPASRNDDPAIGSVVAKLRGARFGALPYVWLPFRTTALEVANQPIPGMLGGYLGARFDPFFILDDPGDPEFSVPSLTPPLDVDRDRLGKRYQLLNHLNKLQPAMTEPFSKLQKQSMDLVSAPELQKVFSLSDEPDTLQDAYGRNRFGASLLLARRLIEWGSRFVCVSMGPDLNNTWDTHIDNFGKLKRILLPRFDSAISSLLSDLAERGRLERTLVLAMGEFGRTPKIDNSSMPGRSHWPDCYSLLMAGGGIKPGFVYGSSDDHGAFPKSNPATPGDIIATLFHCLGVPAGSDTGLSNQVGKPVSAVPKGNWIESLLV